MTFCGNPACENISWICSTIVGVCGDGFKITELPASKAGIRELTRMRYGYYSNHINTVSGKYQSRALGAAYVPGKEDQDRSHRKLSNVPLEASFWLSLCVFQNLVTDLQEILPSQYGRGNFFGPVSDWSSHLLSQLSGQNILSVAQQLQGFCDDGLSLLKRSLTVVIESLGSFDGQQCDLWVRQAMACEDRLIGCWRNCRDYLCCCCCCHVVGATGWDP